MPPLPPPSPSEPTDPRPYAYIAPEAPAHGNLFPAPGSPSSPPPLPPPLPPVRTPDPGSRRAATIAWVIFIITSLTIAVLQQIGASGLSKSAQPATPPQGTATRHIEGDGSVTRKAPLAPPGFDAPGLQIKLSLKLADMDAKGAAAQLDLFAQQYPKDEVTLTRVALANAGIYAGLTPPSATDNAHTPEAALDAALAKVTDPDLIKDLTTAKTIYAAGSLAASGVTESEQRLFRERHAYLADLALWFNDPAHAAERSHRLSGGLFIMVFIIGLGGLAVLAFFVGLGLLIAAAVGAPGRLIFAPPPAHNPAPLPGGSLPIELAALFTSCFLAMKLIIGGLAALGIPGIEYVSLTVPWLITLLLLVYPLIRGVPFSTARQTFGLTSGKGILTELSLGVLGWLAALPLLVVAVFITLAMLILVQLISGERTQPSSAIPEFLASSSPIELILLLTLMTLWAPFTEELVFRGALFRQFRTWAHPIFAGLISAFFFAIMHGYPFYMLTPVFTLGFAFALMRQWRGSLIAPIAAHCLNNALVGFIFLFFLRFLLN